MWMSLTDIKAAMVDTLFQICREDATDSAAYVYAFDRLAEYLESNPEDSDGCIEDS